MRLERSFWSAWPIAMAIATLIVGCGGQEQSTPVENVELSYVDDIEARVAQFVPQSLEADLSGLSEGDRKALRYMTGLPGINYNVKVANWVPQIKSIADVLKPEGNVLLHCQVGKQGI